MINRIKCESNVLDRSKNKLKINFLLSSANVIWFNKCAKAVVVVFISKTMLFIIKNIITFNK